MKCILTSFSGDIKDLSTLKSNIHFGLAGLGEYHFWGRYLKVEISVTFNVLGNLANGEL